MIYLMSQRYTVCNQAFHASLTCFRSCYRSLLCLKGLLPHLIALYFFRYIHSLGGQFSCFFWVPLQITTDKIKLFVLDSLASDSVWIIRRGIQGHCWCMSERYPKSHGRRL